MVCKISQEKLSLGSNRQASKQPAKLKAAYSVTFDLLILKMMFLFFKNYIYVKIQRSRIIGGTQIITNKGKIHLFDKIIHFSMQFSAVLNIFIVKT